MKVKNKILSNKMENNNNIDLKKYIENIVDEKVNNLLKEKELSFKEDFINEAKDIDFLIKENNQNQYQSNDEDIKDELFKYRKNITNDMKTLLKQKYNHYYGDIESYTFEDNKLYNDFINTLTLKKLEELFENIKIELSLEAKSNIDFYLSSINFDTDNYKIIKDLYYKLIGIVIRNKYFNILNVYEPKYNDSDKTYFEQMLVAELLQNFDLIINEIIKKYDKQIFDYLFGQKYYMISDAIRK